MWRRAAMPRIDTSPTSYSPGPSKQIFGVAFSTTERLSVAISTSLLTDISLRPTTDSLGSLTTRVFFVVKTTPFAPLYSISNIVSPFTAVYFPCPPKLNIYRLIFPL